MAIPRLDFREGTEILVPPEVKGPQVHIFPKAEPKSMDDMVMTSEIDYDEGKLYPNHKIDYNSRALPTKNENLPGPCKI